MLQSMGSQRVKYDLMKPSRQPVDGSEWGVAVSVAGVASGGFNIQVCLRVWGRMGCSGHAVIAFSWWSPGVAPHPPVSAEHVVGLGVPQEGVCALLCGRPGAC